MNIDYSAIDDPRFGIVVYKTPLNATYSASLEKILSESTHPYFRWNPALVGYSEMPDPNYRKCWDCKVSHKHISQMPKDLEEIYVQTATVTKACVDHYSATHNIQMNYMEAVNFVKYGPGEHFAMHSDHGHSYVCTVSTVGYFNDDYEGGELEFSKLGFKIKPQAGDVVVFPSTYIYMHASLPVTAGTKYSAVTMFDYNDTHHQSHTAPTKPPVFHAK